MGPWWSLGYGNPDSFRNDNNANWQAYPLYTKDGEWNIHMKDVGTTYTMVNKNASDDVKKAIVIMNNVLVRDESTFDTSVAIGWYPLRNTMAATDECEYEYDALMGIIKGEASADDYQQGGSKFNGLYKNLANDAATLKDVISEDYDGSRDLTVTDMDVNTTTPSTEWIPTGPRFLTWKTRVSFSSSLVRRALTSGISSAPTGMYRVVIRSLSW